MDIIFRVQRGFCPSRVDTIEFVQNTLIAHRFNALHQALAGEQTLCKRGLFALCFCTHVECSYRCFGDRIGRAVNEVIEHAAPRQFGGGVGARRFFALCLDDRPLGGDRTRVARERKPVR